MPERSEKFDPDAVRNEWDTASDAYAEGQATGRDYYRLEFFGPAQIALCGEVQGLRLLEVGCGTGYFAREMARRGAVGTAVDLSPGMLAHARESESTDPLGIRYLNGDAARLREYLDAEPFDMVTSCLALQDMPDIPKVFRAIHDVLVPGGRLVASIAHPCNDMPFRVWAKDSSGAKQWLCVDRYFDRGPVKYAWKDWLSRRTTQPLKIGSDGCSMPASQQEESENPRQPLQLYAHAQTSRTPHGFRTTSCSICSEWDSNERVHNRRT